MRKTNEMDLLVQKGKTILLLNSVMGILCLPFAIMVYQLGEASYELYRVKGTVLELLALSIILVGGILISRPMEYVIATKIAGKDDFDFFMEEEDYYDDVE